MNHNALLLLLCSVTITHATPLTVLVSLIRNNVAVTKQLLLPHAPSAPNAILKPTQYRATFMIFDITQLISPKYTLAITLEALTRHQATLSYSLEKEHLFMNLIDKKSFDTNMPFHTEYVHSIQFQPNDTVLLMLTAVPARE